MSLLVVHDLERRPNRAAIQAVMHTDPPVIELIGDAGDATALAVLVYRTPRAPRAALLRYQERTFPTDVTDVQVAEPGEASEVPRHPWRRQHPPRFAFLQQGLPDDGDAPPPVGSMGDATGLSVVIWRPWHPLRHWAGLYRGITEDEDGPSFNYASTSDYFVRYDPWLYSPASRWLYQQAPAHDESVAEAQTHTALDFTARRPPKRMFRRRDALYQLALSDDSESGQSAAVDVAEDTETAFALTIEKRVALGLAAETDTAIILSRPGTLAQIEEIDTAAVVAPLRIYPMSVVAESELAQALSPNKTRPLGMATETDSAQIMRLALIAVLGSASETDVATALTSPVRRLVGVASETEFAQSVTVQSPAAPAAHHKFLLYGPSHVEIVAR